MNKESALGQFATRHSLSDRLHLRGPVPGRRLRGPDISSSVFPQTNFPRVVILVDNGVMPADEMMATDHPARSKRR